jgi:hypothetical protein
MIGPATSGEGDTRRRERRRGVGVALAGLVVGVLALWLLAQQTSRGDAQNPSVLPALLFLAGAWIYGFGVHRVLWARPGAWPGVPPRVRPWISAVAALVTWWALSTAAGLVAGALRPR